MNIIEAVKSGKKFRRKSWGWKDVTWCDPLSSIGGLDRRIHITAQDVEADDWEVEPDPGPEPLSEFQIQAIANRVADMFDIMIKHDATSKTDSELVRRHTVLWLRQLGRII